MFLFIGVSDISRTLFLYSNTSHVLIYQLLSHLDFEKYPIDVICVESFAGEGIRNLMREKGYRLLAETQENEIYVSR